MEPASRADRRYLFIDMNSFFASCEQAENPKLRYKPVITIPTEGSCALSASYEAKAFGVKTGTPEKEARFLCPGLQVVKARPKVYMDYHYRLEKILTDISPRVSMKSVDEGSLQLFQNEDPWQLAAQIKVDIWQKLSPVINCSIGIAPNIFLAKTATELQKPNGLVEIKIDTIEEQLAKLDLRDLCGISFAMERRLKILGVNNPVDFYNTPSHVLREAFGVIGQRWWLKLHGYETHEGYVPFRKSLSHSHVLPPHQRSVGQAYVTLKRLITKVGRRLRKNGCMTSRIDLSILYIDKTYGHLGMHVRPTSDTLNLSDYIEKLWQQLDPKTPVLKLSIWTSGIVPDIGIPPPLFPEDRKRQSLAQAIDKINDRHGVDMVRFAILDKNGSRAPDRISFNSLFDIEHE